VLGATEPPSFISFSTENACSDNHGVSRRRPLAGMQGSYTDLVQLVLPHTRCYCRIVGRDVDVFPTPLHQSNSAVRVWLCAAFTQARREVPEYICALYTDPSISGLCTQETAPRCTLSFLQHE
jgi:hypothetical protein